MIAHLRGIVIEKEADEVVIEAGGVGYRVFPTGSALRSLPELGREGRLFVHMHATQEGPPVLYGFADADERRLFDTLLGVQGVGPKVAVAVLSGLPAGELVKAIAAGDVARLTQIRGVGRKTAERIAVELRDKVGAVAGGGKAAGAAPVPTGKLGDVHGALLSLGYKASEFEVIVANLDPSEPTADLIRKALASLRRS